MFRKILVAQGGGPTAVINQSLAGIALEARKQAGIGAVYGAFHGVRGIINQDFTDLGRETEAELEKVAATRAVVPGSARGRRWGCGCSPTWCPASSPTPTPEPSTHCRGSSWRCRRTPPSTISPPSSTSWATGDR